MVGEIVHAGMDVNISREKKTLPMEAPAFPPEMTNDRATGHCGGPLSFEQGVVDMQESVLCRRQKGSRASPGRAWFPSAGTRAAPAQATGIILPNFL